MQRFTLIKDIPAKQQPFVGGYPAVRIFSTRPNNTISKNQMRLNDDWVEFVRAHNSDRANQYLFQPQAGVMYATWLEVMWVNINKKLKRVVKVMPRYQSEGFFENVVDAVMVNTLWKKELVTTALLKTLRFQDGPPDPNVVNFINNPELIHIFTVEQHNGDITPPPLQGEIVYVPLISDTNVYLDPKWLKLNSPS